MTRVLITGGMGYVGGRVAAYLAAAGQVLPRLGTRSFPLGSVDWVRPYQVAVMDYSSPDSLEAACQGVEAVVHCAAVNEIESAKNPELALRINTMGSLELLQAARRAGVGRFMYFSTAHVYGAPLVGDIDETKLPRPSHPYAITHRAAEDFVLAAHDLGHIDGVVLRLANGFGVPAHPKVDRWTLVVNDMCRQAAAKGVIVVRAPNQVRDFLPLEDVSRAVEHLLALPRTELGNGLFNLGGGMTMTMLEMAELVAERCKAVLDISPSIDVLQPPSSATPSLNYRCDKLLATGFVPTGGVTGEIDATLRMCAASFSE